MNRRTTSRHCAILLLAGISLVGLMLVAPLRTIANSSTPCLLKIITSASWSSLPDSTTICCCLELMVLFAGLFLIIESAGTLLAVFDHKHTAMTVYCLHCVPALGILLSGIFLVKTLF